jgi:hypothetical protein
MALRHPVANAAIGAINLHREWRAQQADRLEFIVLARCYKHRVSPEHRQGLYVMLVERIDVSTWCRSLLLGLDQGYL